MRFIKRNLGDIVLAVIAIIFLANIGIYAVHSNKKDAERQRIQTICDFLSAEKQGDVCIKDNLVVYPEAK